MPPKSRSATQRKSGGARGARTEHGGHQPQAHNPSIKEKPDIITILFLRAFGWNYGPDPHYQESMDCVRTSVLLMMLMSGMLFYFIFLMPKIDVKTFDVDETPFPVMTCFPNEFDDHLILPNIRTVLMVIDAWRLDFLSQREVMKFTRHKIKLGRAVAFDAQASLPTVTMPRLKSIISGANPSIMGLAENFLGSFAPYENWIDLYSKKYRDKRIVFYGDDTWLRLFNGPKTFNRFEGVHSFDVKDTKEVDNNVTRNLNIELKNKNWDLMILHYLGLDHIGHSKGNSSHDSIDEKLKEMDDIIKNIWSSLQKEPTLLVILGDHGMTNEGSHGGGSEQETHVPIVFMHSEAIIREKQQLDKPFKKVKQNDIAATMATFLDIDVPLHNQGISMFRHIHWYWRMNIRTVFNDEFRMVQQYTKRLDDLNNKNLERILQVWRNPKGCILAKEIADEIEVSDRDEKWEILQNKLQAAISGEIKIYVHVAGLILLLANCYALDHLIRPYYKRRKLINLENIVPCFTWQDTAQAVFMFMPAAACFSNSMVEEQHDMWYFMVTSVSAARLFYWAQLYYKNRIDNVNTEKSLSNRDTYWRNICNCILLMIYHRIAMSFTMHRRRRWSMNPALLPAPVWYFVDRTYPFIQVYYERFITFINTDDVPMFISLISSAVVLSEMANNLLSRNYRYRIYSYLALAGMLLTILPMSWRILCQHRNLYLDYNWTYKFMYLLCFEIAFFYSPSSSIICYILHISKHVYIPLLALCYYMGKCAAKAEIKGYSFVVLAQASFFYIGTSYNPSSIDIMQGYEGVNRSSASTMFTVVGPQVFLNIYGPTITLILSYLLYSNASSLSKWTRQVTFWPFHFLFTRLLYLFASILACEYFRDHLFLQSVYAPKVFFESVHTLIMCIIFTIVCTVTMIYYIFFDKKDDIKRE